MCLTKSENVKIENKTIDDPKYSKFSYEAPAHKVNFSLRPLKE